MTPWRRWLGAHPNWTLWLRPRWVRWRLGAASRRWLARRGIVVQRRGTPEHYARGEITGRYYPVDFKREWIETVERVTPYTLTSPQRIAALCAATEYLVRHEIPGDFVECGVGFGGSVMAMALTLEALGAADRDLYLFDTFSGMTEPTEEDADCRGERFLENWPSVAAGGHDTYGTLPEVRAALEGTGYDPARLHFVEGRVEDTLPDRAPSRIAMLRLDTDWYESTRHELIHLYPRLVRDGVLIIDDYGYSRGARQATDEYLEGQRMLLNRIDYTGRIGVKQR